MTEEQKIDNELMIFVIACKCKYSLVINALYKWETINLLTCWDIQSERCRRWCWSIAEKMSHSTIGYLQRLDYEFCSHKKLHGMKPLLNDSYKIFDRISFQKNSQKCSKWLNHPPTNSYEINGHIKRYSEMWYNPKLAKNKIASQLTINRFSKDYHNLVGITHFGDELGL